MSGSLWNKNSWHWEEKDYNKVAISKLTELLSSVDLKGLKTVSPTGFASVSVRKKKKVIVFEFSIILEFDNSHSIRIPEFSNDELEPVFRVEGDDDETRKYLRENGPKKIQPLLDQFVLFINSVESEEDSERRKFESEKTEKALIEKGKEKEELLAQSKSKNETSIGSVWNANSYHWETRKLDEWAKTWIKTELGKMFQNINVTGDCESSIRKGKKICIFNLEIVADSLSITNFSNDTDEEWKINGGTDEDKLFIKEQLFDQFLQILQQQ